LRAALLTLAVLLLAGCSGGTEGSAGGCRDVTSPTPKRNVARDKPTQELDPSRTYVLAVLTSCGDFEITLDPKLAPHTTASLVVLSDAGYYDRTAFHRVVPGFVIQGGDPTGTGGGGPGYTTVDKPPPNAAYTRGVVAMAKAPTEPAGTSGSQFFVVTAEDARLPPDYAIVGRVTSGYDTVKRIDALGSVETERPSQPVVVEQIRVAES